MNNNILKSASIGLILIGSSFVGTANAGLIGLYNYDDASNLGLDISANGNNLTNNGGTHEAAGLYNGSLTLNGASTLTGTLTGLPVGNSSYTLASWIFSTGGRSDGGIIGYGNYGAANQVNALRMKGFNGLRAYWWGNDLDAVSPVDFRSGWQHVATTYDAISDARAIYVNGVLVASQTMSGLNAQQTNFAIGKTVGNEYFTGNFDDTAIFDEALSLAQIQTIKDGDFSSFGVATIPEPASLAIFALGVMGLASRRYKKQA